MPSTASPVPQLRLRACRFSALQSTYKAERLVAFYHETIILSLHKEAEMKQDIKFNYRRTKIRLAVCTLLCTMAGLLLSSSGRYSTAQQQTRQLVQGEVSPPNAGKRIALVIGNGAYTNAPALKNPPNDARDMAGALSKLGFDVEHGIDLNQKQMKFMIRQFGQKLKAGGQGVFYYAGHGVQSKGRNYLIPVDAVIESEADLEDAGVDVQLMLNYMDDAQNGLNIVILDACRNNPFGRSMRSAENGLAKVDAPTGTLIAYSTKPGSVASDGLGGRNGLYTAELLKQIRVPGVSVTEMFMSVRAEVVKQTNGKQVPWDESSLIGAFSFNAAANNAGNTSKPSTRLEDAGVIEAEYWESIKNSTDAADYQEYLKEYPQGRYAQLARLKLRQMETAKNSQNNSSASMNAPMGGNQPSNPTTDGAKAAPRVGTSVRNQMGMEFVYVPAGSFMMGSSDAEVQAAYRDVKHYLPNEAKLEWFTSEKPQHEVTIRVGLYMGRYEVTQAQWQTVMGSNPSYFKNCGQCPVEQVSWSDAQEFIRRINTRSDDFQYRLPTEAEWEYACRAGTTTSFAFGDSLSSKQANFYGNEPYGNAAKGVYRKKTTPVGSFQSNAWGLYDMHGNVWEWCEDMWHENYNDAPSDGTAWVSNGDPSIRVLRGGDWISRGAGLRSVTRHKNNPSNWETYGFRLVAVART